MIHKSKALSDTEKLEIYEKETRRLRNDMMIMLGNDNKVWQFWHRMHNANFWTRLKYIFCRIDD